MKELFILPFDHRSSFSEDILGTAKVGSAEKKKIEELKNIIFQAFLLSLNKQKQKDHFAILVDEQYGQAILKEARNQKIKICVPVEKSGQECLSFQYGKNFEEHIEKFKPDFVKVLIRYNPLNIETDKKQLSELKKLDTFCKKNNYRLMLELLVPPSKKDSDCRDYDKKERLERTIGAIKEIKKVIAVDLWKLEGFTPKQWQEIIPLVGKSNIIFLGRGQEEAEVKKWLKSAVKFQKIIGFAIGRTVFLKTLKEYYAGRTSKDAAVKNISAKFDYFVKLWRENR